MGVDMSSFVLLYILPLIVSVILFIDLIVRGLIARALISVILAMLLILSIDATLPNNIGTVIDLMFGPWMLCIAMFIASVKPQQHELVSGEERYMKPKARILDPCAFNDEHGRLLTIEASLDLINSFDRKSCDEFLSSLGYPETKKEESLMESRQRCVSTFKKERIVPANKIDT